MATRTITLTQHTPTSEVVSRPTTPSSEAVSRPSSPDEWDRWTGQTCNMCGLYCMPADDWVSDSAENGQRREDNRRSEENVVPCHKAGKDQRAYEVMRNKQKSLKEYAHMRNRRRGLNEELMEKVGWMPFWYGVGDSAPVPRLGRPRDMCDMDQEEWVATAYYRQNTTVSKRRLRREEAEERDQWYEYGMKMESKPGIQVSLQDLVTTKQPRKTKKKREHDFEFIPHVQSVIVLEDVREVPVAEEPWEYLDSSDDEKVGSMPTYAKVVKTVS